MTEHFALTVRSTLARWLLRFSPDPVAIDWPERLRSCLGALLGLSFTAGLMHIAVGSGGVIPLLVAPMGASAVLLFAVPASPLAQPWSLIGGNLVSACVGVLCARWVANPLDAAPLAVALSIAAMFALRCVHPPSGAVALTAVLGGPAVHALGFGFVLAPIALQSFALLAVAIVFHRATGHRYPHARQLGALSPRTPAQSPAAGFTSQDLSAVLGRRNEVLDIAADDLEALLSDLQTQSYVRTFQALTCADLMARTVITVSDTTPVHEAAALLRRHPVKALPVIDGQGRVVGIVTRADLERSQPTHTPTAPQRFDAWRDRPSGAAVTIAAIMTAEVFTVAATAPIAQLVPVFTAHGHHHIPVVDAQGRLAGMLTQADLIQAIYRHSERGAAAA
jgi:CBS domain-containing membrane protein